MQLSHLRNVWTVSSCLWLSPTIFLSFSTSTTRAFSIRSGPAAAVGRGGRHKPQRQQQQQQQVGVLASSATDNNSNPRNEDQLLSASSSQQQYQQQPEYTNSFPDRNFFNDTTSDDDRDNAGGTAAIHAFPGRVNGLDASLPYQQQQYESDVNKDQKSFSSSSSSTTTTTPKLEKKSDAAAYSVLAIDPSEIEIVTIEAEETRAAEEATRQALLQQQSLSSSSTTSINANNNNNNLMSSLPFVSMFRGSANYIANHRNTIAVLHIPGDLLDFPDPTIFRDLMNDVALTWLLGVKLVLVVGCRYQIEKRLGEGSNRAHGLRVTDQESLRVVKEEAGYVRFEVERQLARSLRMQGSNSKKSGPPSATATGGGYFDANVLSGNFYSAQPFGVRDGVDYKYTGFVRRVEVEKINQALNGRDICLLTTLGVSPSGEVFNVNSESLAAAVAGSLSASKVIYFTEKETELRHAPSGSKIQHLRVSDARNLLKYADVAVHRKGYVTLGDNTPANWSRSAISMLTKFGFSMQALEQGVKRAHVISPKHGSLLQELYTRDGSGTMISGDLYDGIRRAEVTDVAGIHELISPLIQMGTLIDRPKATLEKDIDSYFVYTRDNHIVACGQLKPFENGFAEIGCLVVNKDYRSRGRGDAMLGFLERLCLLNGCTNIFVLSTQTMEWFMERGFEEAEVDRLPPSRQKTYNYSRRSKIYMKKIESQRDLDASELWWNR